MKIAGYSITRRTEDSHVNGDAVLIYHHHERDVYFVTTVFTQARTIRSHRPKDLRALIKTNPSGITCYVHAEHMSTPMKERGAAIRAHFALNQKLFRCGNDPNGFDMSVTSSLMQVYVMQHYPTGALYYDHCDIEEKAHHFPNPKMVAFNGSVLTRQPTTNRVIYYFAEKHFPLDAEDWGVIVIDSNVANKQAAEAIITKLSSETIKTGHLVLNRIAGCDALVYRNSYLNLIPVTMQMYVDNINL